MRANQPEYMKRPNDTEEHIIQNIQDAWTTNTEEGRQARIELEQGHDALVKELQGVFDATERGKEINTRYSNEYQQAFNAVYGRRYEQDKKRLLAQYQSAFDQSNENQQIIAQYQNGTLTEAQANTKLNEAFQRQFGQRYQQEAGAILEKYNNEFSETDKAKDINARHNDEYNRAFAEDMDGTYKDQMSGLAQAFNEKMMAANGDFYEGRMREMKHNVANKMIENTAKFGAKVFKPEKVTANGYMSSVGSHNPYPDAHDEYKSAYQNFLYKAEQRMNDMSIDKYQFGDFSKNVAYDLGGILESSISFGLSDWRDRKVLTSIFEKVNAAAEGAIAAGKDPQEIFDNPSSVLNDKERAVYDAYCTYLAADIARQTDTSYLADAAKLTADMIPFMVEVGAMNGIFGGLNRATQNAITRGMARSIVNKLPRGFMRTAARGLTGLTVNFVGAGLYAAESGAMALVLPRTYANMLQNKIDVADKPGAITLNKDRLVINDFDVYSTSDAFFKAWRDEWKELFTETGGIFNVGRGVIFKNPIAKQVSRKVNQTSLGKLIDTFSSGKYFELAKQMGYHGTYQEWTEEVEGTCWDYVFGDEDAFDKFFSEKTQIPMLISFSIPSVIGGGINAARELSYRREYKKATDNVLGLLQKYGYSMEDIDGIKQNLYTINVEDIPTEVMKMASMLTNADDFGEKYGEYTRLKLKERNLALSDTEKAQLAALHKDLFETANAATADTKVLATELTKLAYSEVALASIDRDIAHERSHAIEEMRQYYRDEKAEKEQQAQQASQLTPEQQQQDHQAELRQQAAQAAQAEVQGMAHQDGNVYEVKQKGTGKHGFIVGSVNPEYNAESGALESKELITVKWDDGTITQPTARELEIVQLPVSADELMQERTDHYFAQYANNDLFHVGDKVYLKQNGQQSAESSTIVGINDDGIEVEIIDPNGQPNTTIIPHEEAAEALAVEEGETEDNIVTYNVNGNELRLRDLGNGTYETLDAEEGAAPHRFTDADLAQLGAQRVDQPVSGQPPMRGAQPPLQQTPMQNPTPQAPMQPVSATPQVPQFGSNAPGIDELSAEDFAAQTVSFMQSPKVAQGYLTAERAKVNAQLQQLEKEGVTEYNSAEEYRTKAQQLEQSKARLQAQLEKIDGAIAAINAQAEAAVARKNLNEAIRKRAAEFSKQLGANIVIFDSLEQIPESQALARQAYEKVGDDLDAWYDENTGDIYMNANAFEDMQRFEEKVFHEVISHKGLDQLLGKAKYDKLCDAVWNSMSEASRNQYMAYARATHIRGSEKEFQRIAAKEYIAFLSEKRAALELNDQSEEANTIRSEWAKICEFLKDLFSKIFGNVQITDEDLAKLVHASFVNMQRQAQGITEEQAPTDNIETTETPIPIDAQTDTEGQQPASQVTEPAKIVPERPNSKQLQGMSYNVAEAEDMLGRMVRNILDENGYEDVEIVGTKVIGSRVNGNAREDSDLDCLIEFKGNAREDSLFNLFEEQGIELDGVKVDINPITEGKSGTIEQFMRRSDEYLAEKAATQALYDALAQAEAETDTDPTEAQKKAENYKQGHVTLWGLPITIENPRGSIRRGTDANGKQWEQEMHHTYGKIRRTEGVDGDHIDVFIGPNLTSDKVFVVDQRNVDTGEFDEHKCMLGFDSLEEAQNGYLSNYEEGWQGMGTVTEVTMDEFKKWIDSSHRKTKPFADYKSVKTEGAASTAMEEPTENRETNETQAEELTPLEAAQKRKAAREAAKAAEQAAQTQGESEMLTRLRELEEEGEDQQAPQDYLHSLTDEQLEVLDEEVNELWNKARTENNLRDLNDQQIREQYPEAWKTLLMRNRVSAENSRRWDMQTTEESIANRKAHTESEELRRYYEYEFAYMRASASKGDVLKAVHDAEEYLAGLSYEELAKIYNEIVRLQSEHDVPWILSNAYRARSANMENEGVFDYGLNHQGEIPEGKANKPKINASDWTAKDDLRPVMNGVYHDPTGVGVVTNAHILMATPSLYDPAQEGKIVKKDGSTVDGKFPNWQGVVDQARRINKKEAVVDWTAIRNFIAGIKAKMKEEGNPLKKDSLANIIIRMPDGQVIIFRLNSFIPFADAAAAVGANTLHYSPINGQTLAETGDSHLVIMPVDPESFRKNLDWGYKDNFYYDLQPKQDEPVSAETPKTESKPERKPKPTRKKAAPAEQTQAPVETDAEVIETQKPKNTDKIEDVGEKIGGARKDIVQETVDRINVNGDTFAKIFPKFDYHKLIANGLEPRLAAGLKYVCEHAKKSYKIRKKRFGENNALEATRFMANYAKGYLLGDTSLDFTSEGWVFTAYGKRRYEFGIKLWESLREAMGDTMFDVDLSGYDCDVIQSEEERKAEAEEKGRTYRPSSSIYYRRNADGESVEFTPRYAINTPKGDKLFTAEEYDQAVQYFQDQVTSAINYQAANPFELAIYRKRGSDDCCVHAKIGGKWVELTPWGKEYGLKYRDEHRAELQAMAQRKAEELKEQRKNTRPEAKVEVKWFPGTQEQPGEYRIATKVGKEYVPISDPMLPKDIWRYAREHHDELQSKAQELLNAYLDEQEANRGWKPQLNIGGLRNRVGTDWRNGADVTAERFRTEFGFRGVEFGNYVTQKERQRLLNECFDALHDMAEILGVSPRALSLNGQLGFAIGARGGAGAKAHYEPGKNVINLTKKNGWGALAHEWWHAMDYYFGKREKERPATSGIFRDDVRKQMQDAFAAVMKAINDSEYLKRSQNLDAKTNKRYYAEDTELGARAFEDYIAKQLIERGQVNDFLSHHTAEEDWNGDISNYPYPIEKDGTALADAFQSFFDTVEEQEDASTGNSVLFSVTDKKYAQFALTHANNPMLDDVHTGIRSVEDIHTLEETLNDDKLLVTEPDWEEEDIRRAIEDNQVTIYSSKPIQDGTFVTPSRMVAEDYAGGEMVYEKTVTPDKVAWIASDEGQYADVDHYDGNILFSITNANNEIFYSNAERAVEGIKQDKATPEQWRAMIEKAGGLKAGEDKWIGLSDWLAQQRPTIESHPDETPLQFAQRAQAERKKFTISKQEILHYIRANKIQIEETEYGETTPENNPTFRAFQDEVTEMWENVNRMQNGRFNEANQDIIRFEDDMQAKYGDDWRDLMDDSERNTMNYLQERRDEINMEVFLPEEVVMEEMCNRHGDDFQLAFSIDDDGSLSIANEDAAGYYLDVNPINDTRLQYTTEGLTNKHEIAMTVPTIEAWNETDEIHFGDAGEGKVVAWARFGDAKTISKPEELAQAEQEYKEFSRKMIGQYGLTYTERVMSDSERQQESDLIAKLNQARKDHPQVEEKVLVIDEIQSKRHQEGREQGYKDSEYVIPAKKYSRNVLRGLMLRSDEATKKRQDYRNSMQLKYNVWTTNFADVEAKMSPEEREEFKRLHDEETRAHSEYLEYRGLVDSEELEIEQHTRGIPAAPFEKNWHELAMKRILRFAAENGYDKVAWTTGDQQAARYDIGKVVDLIEFSDWIPANEEENDYGVDYRKVIIRPRNQMDMWYYVDRNGNLIEPDEGDPKTLAELVGKDLARNIVESSTGNQIGGEGLRIGGEGMRGFYDDILPRFMQKYGKKWGVQVGEVTMPQLEDGYQTMHAIDINDAMRESVMEGQPMFSITPKNTSLDQVLFSITVNHNSPYLLKKADGSFVDPETGERLGFDHRFMGRGEGGQAHGWGSYFSANDIRSYGEGYGFSLRDIKDIFNTSRWQSFGVGDAFNVAKNYLLEAHSEHARSLRKWLEDRLAQKQELLKSYEGKVANIAEEDLMVFRAEADVQYIPALLRDMVKDIDTRNRHHYDVEIPDDNGTNYFEEDQPLTHEQIDRLRKAAKETGIPKFLETISGFLRFAETNPEEYPFRKFYSDITDFQYGYPRETISNFLKDAGFTGIHYNGQRDGECYVIFDENDAVITNHVLFSLTPKTKEGKKINDQFNAELQQQIEGTLPAGHIYKFGRPSSILQNAGIADLPIEMAASRLVSKSMQEEHPYTLDEVRDLPVAIQNPLAVFVSATHVGDHVVLTELKHGKKSFVAALRVNTIAGKINIDDIQVNSIRSVHYRSGLNIVNWINEDLGTYFAPDFEERWLNPLIKELRPEQRYNSADVRTQLKNAAKVVKDFHISKLLDEKSAEKAKISSKSTDLGNETPKNTSLDQVLFSITVNHNSPYLLKKADGSFVDPVTGERLGFDHRFMGTGEGAQSHGWGSYFSQNDIEGYRQETTTYKEEPVAADPYSDNAAERALFYKEQEGGTLQAVKFLRELMREEDDADTKREYQESIDALMDVNSWGERRGHHYTVEIPDNDGTNYLDEMKTLPKPLRRKIAAAVRELPGKPERSVKYVDYVGGWNQLADMIERNQWAYLEIRDRLFNAFGGYPIDSEKRLSKLMSSLGFVGVHYDGRRNGECYVIFDENDAKIVDHVMFSITPKDPVKAWEQAHPKPEAKADEATIDYAKRLQEWNKQRKEVVQAVEDAKPSYDHAEYDGVLFSVTPPFTGNTVGDVYAGAKQRSDLNRKRRESAAITDMLIKLSKDNYWRMQEALHKINADIKSLRKAAAMQADLDRLQVEALLDLTNQLIQVQWGGGSDNPAYQPQTMATIIQQVRNAIGKADISEEVGKIEDYLVHAQRVAAKNQWDKLRRTPFEKLNISGVVSQGKVAIQGQHALKALNEALNSRMTVEQLEEEISLFYQKIDEATDESLRTQYTGRMIGYETARQHLERLEELMQERQQLRNELEASRTKKELSPAARRELEASIKETLRDNNLRQAEAYTQSVRDLQEYVSGQTDIAKNFIEQQRQRTEMIRGYAAKDLEGASADPHRTNEKQSGWRKIWDAFASPIRDLQSLLRLTGLHAPDGEGYLYNHFMRNWTDAADKERQGIVAAQKTLDAKISELTHGKYKTWEEAARDIKSKSHNKLSVSLWTGKFDGAQPVYEDRPIDAGNALYIYAVNKMNDGRMKLTAMNITDQVVRDLTNQVKEMFGQELLDVVDWVQREFFSELRNRYNPTHEALFGAPMDAIENYFPLRINASARQKDEDITEPDDDISRLLAGTSTGAIKRRKRNSLPLDVRNADFFQEVIRHVAQMERWNAFAQWTRDSNILFSDIDFRNKIKNMDTIYGKGDKLYTYMKKAFQTAVGVYKPQSDIFSEMTLNLAKGVTSAKINFRVFTALKQLASFPAFFTYMTESGFVKSYMSSWAHPHDTMKWAKANLPSFEKRVSKRDMGDMRLMQRSTDWEWNKRMLEFSQKYGMYFNVLFDTLTCATGAKAVYESRLAEYKKKGYSTAVAESRARQDAEQAFNTSQQSSEGAYMAPVQMDRNIITAALTVFRTSPIQYTRNCFYHARNLIRKRGKGTKESMINFRTGQYIADGLTEEQARQAAEKDYNKSVARDIVGMVVYGALLGILWRMVGSLPYLIAGDDDDEKKKILKKTVTGGAIVQPVTGLLGGGIVESAIDGYGNIADMFSPELPFTQDLKKAFDNIGNDKYAEAASQALSVIIQSATGFDPSTVADMITRTVTTLDSDAQLDAAQQAWQISGAVLSIPQSQYEQIMLDDLVKAGKGIDMSNTFGKRKFEPIYDKYLSDFSTNREIRTAPLTWYLRSDEQAQKAEASAERRFRKLLKERGLNDLPYTKVSRDKKKKK